VSTPRADQTTTAPESDSSRGHPVRKQDGTGTFSSSSPSPDPIPDLAERGWLSGALSKLKKLVGS
jgi:hypothetical protein